MNFLSGHGDVNYWTILSSKWQIIASVVAIVSVITGGIFAFFKLLKKDSSQSNTSNIRDVKESKTKISVNQRNNSK